jgi:anti-anti-sigma regulatory factor
MTSDRSPQPITSAPVPHRGAQLTEVVDGRSGQVRASGHLTPQGADLLRGTVEGLLRLGHSTVVLDLTGVQAADDVGLHVISTLRTSMAASGDRLLVRNAPGGDPARD